MQDRWSVYISVLGASARSAGGPGARAGERRSGVDRSTNQVNQEGGYTGLRPRDFRDLVWSLADVIALPRERVLLGSDHLGPNCWQRLPAREALKRAGVMTAEYVRADFRKTHLDCSMACRDDASNLSDELIAERSARLCALAEDAWRDSGGEPLVYVIGSKVPPPGGADEKLGEITVTESRSAQTTVAAQRAARRGCRSGCGEAERGSREAQSDQQPKDSCSQHQRASRVSQRIGDSLQTVRACRESNLLP